MNKIQSRAEQARELALSLPSCHEKAADASRLALALSKICSSEGKEFTFLTPEERARLAAKRRLERG